MSDQEQLFSTPPKPIDKKTIYTEDSLVRRDSLVRTIANLKKSRSTSGAAYITEGNPEYTRLDQFPGGIERINKRSLEQREMAHTYFIKACGKCVLEGCEIRDSWPKFLKKYDGKVGDRKEANKNSDNLLRELSDNPTAPC